MSYINLTYTGADTNNGIQTVPSKSLGGFPSSSLIAFKRNENLFDSESYLKNSQDLEQYRVINMEFTNKLTNVKIGILKVNDLGRFKMQLGAIMISNNMYELLFDEFTPPEYVDFNDEQYMSSSSDVQKMFLLGDIIDANTKIGLFLKRTLVKKSSNVLDMADNLCQSEGSYYDNMNNDGFDLIIKYDFSIDLFYGNVQGNIVINPDSYGSIHDFRPFNVLGQQMIQVHSITEFVNLWNSDVNNVVIGTLSYNETSGLFSMDYNDDVEQLTGIWVAVDINPA